MNTKTVTKKQLKKEEPKQPEAEGTPEPEPSNLISQSDMQAVIEALTKVVTEHTSQIAVLQETLARKRRPVRSNSKVEIRDKQTGKVYPSKNSCYQSLLKSEELKDLVSTGIFGDIPEKNTFGWYALIRALPDRFEEVLSEQASTDEKPQ